MSLIYVPEPYDTPNKTMIDEKKKEYGDSDDLYNRKALLERSLERLDELDAVDKQGVLSLVQFQRDKQNELLWINWYITALIVLRRKLKRVFRDATKDDIRDLFEGLERNGWETPNGETGSTEEKFRKIIKLFYKVVYGQNKFYPEAVE